MVVLLKNYLIWLWQKKLINPQEQERGIALVTAVTFGLFILGTTSLALYNSSQEKTHAQAEEYTKQAMAIAEAGDARTLNYLSSPVYEDLLVLNYDPSISSPTTSDLDWRNPPPGNGTSPCATSTSNGGTIDYSTLLGDSVAEGNYVVKGYQYNSASQTGILTLQGIKSNSFNSQAQIEIGIRIGQQILPGTFPGLYGSNTVSIGNNSILGTNFNIICSDCQSNETLSCTNGEPNQDYLEDAFSINSNNTNVQGKLIIGNPQLPPYPDPPSSPCSATQGYPCYIPLERIKNTDTTFPRIGAIDDLAQRQSWIDDISNTNWNPGDEDQPYIYVLKHNGGGQSDSITGSNITINTSPTIRVRWYVTGNLSFSGTKTITHTGTLEKFAIFGCDPKLRNLLSANSSDFPHGCLSDQDFLLNGSSTTNEMFVYAPEARVGINGGGSGDGITAVVWADSWDASASGQGTLTVPNNAEIILENEFGPFPETSGVEYNYIEGKVSWKRTALSN